MGRQLGLRAEAEERAQLGDAVGRRGQVVDESGGADYHGVMLGAGDGDVDAVALKRLIRAIEAA